MEKAVKMKIKIQDMCYLEIYVLNSSFSLTLLLVTVEIYVHKIKKRKKNQSINILGLTYMKVEG